MKLLLLYRSEEETYWMDLVFLGCWDGSETSYSCKFCDCFYKKTDEPAMSHGPFLRLAKYTVVWQKKKVMCSVT